MNETDWSQLPNVNTIVLILMFLKLRELVPNIAYLARAMPLLFDKLGVANAPEPPPPTGLWSVLRRHRASDGLPKLGDRGGGAPQAEGGLVPSGVALGAGDRVERVGPPPK